MSRVQVRDMTNGEVGTISREALRRSQKQQIPAARLGDQYMLAMGARLSNRYLSTALPEDPAALRCDYNLTGAAIRWPGPALGQSCVLELIDQRNHRAGVDAHR